MTREARFALQLLKSAVFVHMHKFDSRLDRITHEVKGLSTLATGSRSNRNAVHTCNSIAIPNPHREVLSIAIGPDPDRGVVTIAIG